LKVDGALMSYQSFLEKGSTLKKKEKSQVDHSINSSKPSTNSPTTSKPFFIFHQFQALMPNQETY
jgi:hypothetical protein